MKLKNSWRFYLLLAILLVGGGVIHLWERAGEASVSRRALKEMPAQVGSWRQSGPDQRFDQQTESVLRADDYLSRNYALPDGRTASFYVGYYATQRNGATYHSPLNCLPGSGWVLNEPGRILIQPVGGGAVMLTGNGTSKATILIHWVAVRYCLPLVPVTTA